MFTNVNVAALKVAAEEIKIKNPYAFQNWR